MHIWVDADACPVAIRDILVRAARRTGLPLTFVANHAIPVPRLPNITMVQVPGGFDVADDEIVGRVDAGDVVITNDIPLAAEVIQRGGHALSPRGERCTADTVKGRRDMRDFMATLRASGIETGGPPALTQADRKLFADNLDRILAARSRSK